MKRILVVALACVTVLCAEGAKKKAIGCGWGFNNVTVDDFLANAENFDATGLDGVLVWLRGKDAAGKPVGMRNIYYEDWSCEMFAPMVPKLRKMTEHAAFRDNFLITLRAPRKRIAWSDDAAWARVAENMRVAACIARDGGCRGLHMDTEDYSRAYQFSWRPGDPRYDELCKLARRRGAEVFRGVFREYPEAVVLSFWFLSMGNDGCPARCVESSARARGTLWPAFINGILDVMPPPARLVDGNENAYRYEAGQNDFYRSACHVRNSLVPLVAPENREKYARQMQVGFGLYLDMYINPTNSPWYFPPTDGSRLETFCRNFEQAMDAADEYVWIYGEKRQFVKWPPGFRLGRFNPARWEDELPGFADAIFSVKDPDAFARRRRIELEASGALTNLVPNGDCAVCVEGKVPKPFGSWQPGDKANHRGTFGCDRTFGDGDSTSLCAEGVPSGCFAYTIKGVTPGGMYLVKCAASGGATSASIAWKDVKGRYLRTASQHMTFGEAAGRWRRGEIAVRVPAGAVAMQIALGVSLAPGEKAWFDSIGVFPLFRQQLTPSR